MKWFHERLLLILAANNAFPAAQEVPNATKGFVTWFIQKYAGAEYWANARFNLDRGEPRFPKPQLSKSVTPINRMVLSFQAHP
jgi:hypothetical protein